MDSLNNIPNVGNWGDAASKLNDNFNKVKQAVTTVENTSKNNKGYFTSLSALNTAFPSPKAGQTAYVYDGASSTNYYIYNAVNGAWASSTVEAPSVGVDISEYTKTGGSAKTTKDVEDEIVQSIRNMSGNWFSIPGQYINRETGAIVNTSGANIRTDYLNITNVNKIIIKGKSGNVVALCAFYSEDKTFISSIYGTTMDNKIIEVAEIPSNAKYIRATGYGLGDDFLILSTAESLSKDIQDLENSIAKDLNQSIRDISGDWFSITGKYVNADTGVITTTGNPNAVTDYLILDDISFIKIRGRSQGAVALCAFYDKDYTFISSISGAAYHNVDVEILRENFPENAKYFVGNSGQENTDYLFFSTLQSLKKQVDGFGDLGNYLKKTTDSQKKNSIAVADSETSNEVVFKQLEELNIAKNGNWFTIEGKFIRFETGAIATTTVQGAVLTDYLDISNVERIVIRGRSTAVHALYAFYDENKTFISAEIGNNVIITIEKGDFPEGAKYFVGSGTTLDDRNILSCYSIYDTYKAVQDVKGELSKIKGFNLGQITGIGGMGASLMYSGNGWFETAVLNILGVNSYNKAESGVGHPDYFANKLWRGTFCTDEEFENMDILAIQFANNSGLDSEVGLMTNASDYTVGFDIENLDNQFSEYSSAQNLDYILKFWQIRCFEQKDNPQSKWFGTTHGKPFSVIFATHWHDSRPYYNDAIRNVAERWGCSICAFDKKIGFSKNQPIGETQVSVLYAQDTQEVGGVTYGWHPLRGIQGEYIQKKMANIFADTIKEHFGLL